MRLTLAAAASVAVITSIFLLQVFPTISGGQADIRGFEDEKDRFIPEYVSSEYRYKVSNPAEPDYGPPNSVETSTRWT